MPILDNFEKIDYPRAYKAGAQRVDKTEQFIQNCVEENTALTGCLPYL
jgi:hypothetical protein